MPNALLTTLLLHRMMYGLVTGDLFPLFATYIFGEALSIIYVTVYFKHTGARRYAALSISAALAFIVAASLFVILSKIGVIGLSSKQLSNFTGYLMAVGSVLLYVSPFETIAHVLKTRSGASIPIGMCLAGAISNTLWVIDGLLVDDMFVMVLGAVCAFFAAVQVVLFFVFYPKQSAQIADEQCQVQIQIDAEIGDESVHGKASKLAFHPVKVSSDACSSPTIEYVRVKSPVNTH